MPGRKWVLILGASGLLVSAAFSVGGGALSGPPRPEGGEPAPSFAPFTSPVHAGTVNGSIYVANEGTGTISVIDAGTNNVSATICLGADPTPPGTPQLNGPCDAGSEHHKPLYNGHVGTHGLWLTPPDSAGRQVLLATNRISRTVVAVNTADNSPIGYAAVGGEPHLATVRPGGSEAWVAVRGERQVTVLDLTYLFDPSITRRTDRLPITGSIDTALGPSMVSFTSDGQTAFIAAGKQALVQKVDANTLQIVAEQTLPSPFTPFGLVTPDDQELYLVHKLSGTLSILRTSDLGFIVQGLPIGPCANHVAFVGDFAYITTGGPAPCAPGGGDRPGKVVVVDRWSHAIVRELTDASVWTGDPHGIWPSSDGHLYIGHERGNRVTVLDTNVADPSNPTVVAVITDQSTQCAGFAGCMQQPIDVVVRENPTNMTPLRSLTIGPSVTRAPAPSGPSTHPRRPVLPSR